MPETEITQQVREAHVWPVVLIAPAVAWAWVWFVPTVRFTTSELVLTAAAGAVIFGMPAWFWAADHRRVRLPDRMMLGAAVGIALPVVVLLSAILGLLVRFGIEETQLVLTHGAPIPVYGLLPWPPFLSFSIQCVGVGAASGAIDWLVARIRHRMR